MAHNIDAVPNHTFKKGDKVQHIGSGLFATVVEDQTDPTIIKINWDERPEGPQDYRSDAFRVAPWHGLNVKAVPFLFKKANPNQEAIDAIEVQRAVLKKQVEDLQSRLSNLTTAKRLLERG